MNAFKPKKIPENIKFKSPIEHAALIMKKNADNISTLNKKSETKESDNDKILADLANQIFQLKKALERNEKFYDNDKLKSIFKELNIIYSQMSAILSNNKIEIIDLTGQNIDSNISENIDIIGWLETDKPDDYIIETLAPLVKKNEKVILQAKVTGASQNISKK